MHEVKRLYGLAPKTGDGAVIKRGIMPLLDAEPLDGTYTYESLVQNLGLLAQKETEKASGKKKLKDLGLTDAEVSALIGE